jgi:pimeloyl-ACP methyl ester carboxylesterase
MIDIGAGEPVVLIPGLQGRWEWMQPAVERLGESFRVITASLCDEPTSGFPCTASLGFDNYVRQVGMMLDRAGLARATLVGVSFGGLVAADFAARIPERVARVVLVSALPPDWRPDRRARFYLRAPRLLSPIFVATSPLRLRPEVRAAFPAFGPRLRFLASHAWRVAIAPMSPARMARRVRWAEAHRFADMSRVQAPVLVVTGEPGLDRVVPVELTRRITMRVRQARHVVLPRTGHIGIVTRPDRFREVVNEFVARSA